MDKKQSISIKINQLLQQWEFIESNRKSNNIPKQC